MQHHFFRFPETFRETSLRRDAFAILEAGLSAIETGSALRRVVVRTKNRVRIGKRTYTLSRYRRVFVIAIGKVALAAAKTLEDILGDVLTDGVVLGVVRGNLPHLRVRQGTHPLPTPQNVEATKEILDVLDDVDSRDLVLTVISGGGSALLCMPYELECEELARVTHALMERGATIAELNTVRKHLSEVQGGQLARHAYPATVVGLLFSDVPGNDLSVVASGPTFLDPTTIEDAERILAHYDVLKVCALPYCNLKETPKDPSLFRHVYNVCVVNSDRALRGMAQEARRRGYRARIFSSEIAGEAQDVGAHLGRLPRAGEAVLAAGETTVTLPAVHGHGGRNEEVALGALHTLCDDGLVASLASDGIDREEIAGAFVDADIRAALVAERDGLARALREHNTLPLIKRVGAALLTGPLETNVSDLFLSVRARRKKK